MTEIGEVFKIFRTGKNVTLKEASHNIVSYPFLSKFERCSYTENPDCFISRA